MIRLISSTGDFFLVSTTDCSISKFLNEKIQMDPLTTDFSFPDIKTRTLKSIVNFMKHHKGTDLPIIKAPLQDSDLKKVTEEWDAKFIQRKAARLQNLTDLANGAHRLQIQGLVYLVCAMIASLVKGQTLDKVQDFLSKRQKIEEDEDGNEVDDEEEDVKKTIETEAKKPIDTSVQGLTAEEFVSRIQLEKDAQPAVQALTTNVTSSVVDEST